MEISNARRWLSLVVVLAATLLSILNVFISNVALPVIQEDLGASSGEAQLILAGYNFVFGILLITCGRLGDLYGVKRIFLTGLAVFTAASAGAGFAPDPLTLIGARVVQGLGAAFMLPQVMTVIQLDFTGRERGIALGAYAAVGGFGSIAAQLLGGWFIAADWFGLGWRSIYLINIPVGLAAVAGAAWLMREWTQNGRNRRRLDFAGILLASAALSALSIPLMFGGDWGWPWWTAALLAGFPVLVIAFIRHERRLDHGGRVAPVVRLHLFRRRNFSVGNLLILLFYANNAVLFMVMPLTLQRGLGMTPLESGLIFTPLAGGFALMSLFSNRWMERFGQRTMMFGGMLLGISYLMFYGTNLIFGADVSGYAWMPAALAAGLAMGLISAPLNVVTLARVEESDAGSASGIVTAGVEIAYALGTVAGGMIFFSAIGAQTTAWIETSHALHAFHQAIGFNGILVAVMLTLLLYMRSSGEQRHHAVNHARNDR